MAEIDIAVAGSRADTIGQKIHVRFDHDLLVAAQGMIVVTVQQTSAVPEP
jgi:hypothetical protein